MTDDIVTRLRDWAEFAERYVKGADHMILTITKAADEIEWLRQRIGDMRNTIADLELRVSRD